MVPMSAAVRVSAMVGSNSVAEKQGGEGGRGGEKGGCRGTRGETGLSQENVGDWLGKGEETARARGVRCVMGRL